MPRAKPDASLKHIPIELIDEPPLPMRQSMDPEKLEDLAGSIAQLGVLMPICVEPCGERYTIQDGHRRYIASKIAGKTTIPAIVRPAGAIGTEAVKCHANWHREDVSAAEEAVYLAELLERDCAGDIDQLCRVTSQKRNYIEDRLLLLKGDQDVFGALKERRISLAVARELNKVRDRGYRLMFLDAALKGGATARVVMQWRMDADRVTPIDAPAPTNGENQFSTLPPHETSMRCVLCRDTDEPWQMELMYVHRRCRKIFLDDFLARIRGDAAEAQPGGPHDGTSQPPVA